MPDPKKKETSDSEEKRRLIMNAALDAIVCIDTKGDITFWNPQAEMVFGWKETEVMGKRVSSLIIPQQYRRLHDEGMQDYLRTGKGPVLNKLLELSAVKRSGEEFPVEISIMAIRDGNEEFFCAFIRDITERKKAVDALQAVYNEKNTILESIDDGFFAVDNNSLVTYWNKRAELLLSTKREDIIGKNLHEVFAKPDSMVFYNNYQKAMREKATLHFEGFSTRSNKWFAVSAFASDNGLSVYFRDVTESKEYENKLKESNERYNLISKATNDMVWDWDLVTGKVYRNKEGWKKIFGTAKKGIENGTTDDWDKRVHPEDRERVTLFYELAQRSGKDFFEVECRVLRDDGSYAYVHDQGNIFRNEHGKPVRLIGATHDITARKEAEEVLKTSEERYRYLFDNNPASIIIWDITSQKIIEVNNTAVAQHGYSREEFLSKTIWDQFLPKYHARLKIFIEKAMEDPDFKSVLTSKYLNKSGEEIFLNIASHRIQYKGKPVILALATDVTEKVLLERILERERIDRQQEITNAVISAQEQERQELGGELHDNINQILAGSLLYMGLAKKELNTEHPYLNEADTLINSAIVEIRKLSHSLIPPSLNESELLSAINDIIEVTEKGSGMMICLQAPGFDESIIPDKLKLSIYRIVQEQFNNILKHAQAKKVTVRLAQDKEKLMVSIKDDGIGFDTSKKADGVGLMNMKTRASLFNGELAIISFPGKGCELRILFN